MIHNKGKLLLWLAALVAAVGISLVLVAHVALADNGTGTIIIEKQTVPPGGTDFEFTDDIPGGPALFYLDDNEQQPFTGIISGTYSITETNPAVIPGGWILTNVECWVENDITWKEYTVATTTVIIELTNQEVECIFTNERRPPPVVGGYVVPVNKLGLLAPWLALVAMASFAALTVALVKRRRA